MVAAYFRFPLGVYALTTARSTGTPQIPGDNTEAFEFEAVPITSSPPPPLICDPKSSTATWKSSAKHRPNMPSQEAGSNPAPGSSSGSADRQSQDAQGTGAATIPPRTEQELAQVRTRESKLSPKQEAARSTLALGYFPQPRVRVFPKMAASTTQTPRSWPFFRLSPKNLRSAASCTHVPARSSTGSAAAPLNGPQKSA